MSDTSILLTVILSALLLFLPKCWAALPLLIGTLYISVTEQIQVLDLNFPVIRILIATGFLRLLLRGERPSRPMNPVDWMMIFWTLSHLLARSLHSPTNLAFHLGIVLNVLGSYILFRTLITTIGDIRAVYKMTCILLGPMALMMLVEKLIGFNMSGWLGVSPTMVATATNGHYRASGAFSHPILAGTVGAVCLPMSVVFWKRNTGTAVFGSFAALAIVFASGSTGPILATLSVVVALALWPWRYNLRLIRWMLVGLICLVAVVMNDPVYFLMAKIDITGGSTGYFRAQLIRSAIDHLNEWWLIGTDYTRHWMPSGITGNPDHTDMTNFYLQMGVWGGLPLMFLFIGVLHYAFREVGLHLRTCGNCSEGVQQLAWTLGAILVAHATTFFSISYFDQSVVILSMVLGCVGALPAAAPSQAKAWIGFERSFQSPTTPSVIS